MEVTEGSASVDTNVDVNESVESNDNVQDDFANRLKAHRERIKIDGEEIEVDYETMKRDYQLRKASDKKFREAAMMNKRAEDFVHLLKTNPKKVLLNPNLGIDMRSLAEEILAEHLEDEMMDPKDKELKKYKKQLEEIENEKKTAAQKQEEAQIAELREKYSEDYSTQITSALQESNLPKTEHTVKRMAYYMHQALVRGYEMKARDVVDLVRQDYMNETKSLFGAADEDTLISLLGEDTIKKIRKYEAKRMKNRNFPSTPKTQPNVQVVKKPKRGGKLTMSEFKERLKRFD